MSEGKSAFEAYKKITKAGEGPKKNASNSKKLEAAVKSRASVTKEKSPASAGVKNKAQGANDKSNAEPTSTVNTKTNSGTKGKLALKEKASKNSVVAPIKIGVQKRKVVASNGIQEHEVDKLVEELLIDSPSNPKRLTKAQEKKKKELEAFLAKKLVDFEEEDRTSYSTGDDVNSEEEGTTDDSDKDGSEVSEYTMNSYYSSSNDDDIALQVDSDPKFSLNALFKSKNIKAAKRKTNDATEFDENDASTSKKSKGADVLKRDNPASSTSSAVQSGKAVEPKRVSVGKQSTPQKSTEESSAAVTNIVTTGSVKIEPLSPTLNIVKMNSITEGKKMLNWLLRPVAVDFFFTKYWEKNACLVKRNQTHYFSHLISFEAIDQMLLNHHVEFTKNLDVTSYKNGVRQTMNPEGRAMPPIVWDHYGQGCSIRLLNPQTFMPDLFTLNTTMQEYFHCMVGANAYLTPPNSQGFAPHYDDIEAFVLQIEGRKRWKLYAPRNKKEMLPRVSSPNFSQEEIGNPILDEVLEPGDMLYFPRGTIHQASTEVGCHSLHITLSVYQKNSFADLFEKLMPLILQRAIATNLDMRRGLPLTTWQHAGVAFSDNDTKERADLQKTVENLLNKAIRNVALDQLIDQSVDQMAKKFQHEALPPDVLPSERLRTIFGSRSKTNELGECLCDYNIELRTNVRMLRANIMRLVDEEEKCNLYYYLDNSKEYCEYEPNYIEIDPLDAASVEVLIRSYPEYVSVSQFPVNDDQRKLDLATALWERGLLMMEKPFK